MKVLIWKEWREKKLWLLVFAFVMITLPFITHTGLSFGGDITTTSPWIFVSVLPGLLLGLSTFSREMKYECQDFVLSRAIGWKKILGAKITVDCIIMLAGVIVGAIIYWFRVPSDYFSFVGFTRILFGIVIAFGAVLIGYLPGFGASAVLPGMLGGGLVLCLLGITIGAEAAILSNFNIDPNVYYILIMSWILAAAITSIIMTKRGLGLTAKERATKYGKYVFLISTYLLIVLVPFNSYLQKSQIDRPLIVETDISPDGKYMLVNQQNARNITEGYLIRRSDNKTVKMTYISMSITSSSADYCWNGDNTLVFFPGLNNVAYQTVAKLKMDKYGNIIRQDSEKLPIFGNFKIQISPDRHFAAITGRSRHTMMGQSYLLHMNNGAVIRNENMDMNTKNDMKLCIVNLDNMKIVFVKNFVDDIISDYRWESSNLLTTKLRVGKYKDRKYKYVSFRVLPTGKVVMVNDGIKQM